jgi:ribosomal protein S18 acetylase RimI-like enzyme
MLVFRTATLHDIPALNQLVNSAYRGDYSRQGWTTEADLLDGQRTDELALRELIETPGQQLELALNSEQKLLGCVHLRRELPETIYFGMLTVGPSLQGQGLGKKLLEHIELIARHEGMRFIRMTVLPQRKELIAFYERRGFRPTGKIEAFPVNDPRYGLPKVSGLELKEFLKKLVD